MPKSPKVDPTLIARIIDFVDSYNTQTGHFPSTQDVVKQMKAAEEKCRRHITFAVKAQKLDYVYKSSKPVRAKVIGSTRIINYIKTIPEQPPSWVTSYAYPEKAHALSEFKQSEDNLSVFTDSESLIWRKDRPLALACSNVLNKMGFTTEYKEAEGDHDVEIKDDQYFAIAEVTGSDHQIRISNADSLQRYYMKLKYGEEENAEEKEIIPILIGNAFHNVRPSERSSPPFSAPLVKATKNEYKHIHLMSSIDLYQAIGKVLNGSMSREDFRKSFKAGHFYYPG